MHDIGCNPSVHPCVILSWNCLCTFFSQVQVDPERAIQDSISSLDEEVQYAFFSWTQISQLCLNLILSVSRCCARRSWNLLALSPRYVLVLL